MVGVNHPSLFVTTCRCNTFCRHLHLCCRFGSSFNCSTFCRYLRHLCLCYRFGSNFSCSRHPRHLYWSHKFGSNPRCGTFCRLYYFVLPAWHVSPLDWAGVWALERAGLHGRVQHRCAR